MVENRTRHLYRGRIAERLSTEPQVLQRVLGLASTIDQMIEINEAQRREREDVDISVEIRMEQIGEDHRRSEFVNAVILVEFTPAQAELLSLIQPVLPKNKWKIGERTYSHRDGFIFLQEEEGSPSIVGWIEKPLMVTGFRVGMYEKWAQFVRDLASLYPNVD